MELELGSYKTEDEAAYAYNVGMLLINPSVSPNALNYGMTLTDEQKLKVEEKVKRLLIKKGWKGYD